MLGALLADLHADRRAGAGPARRAGTDAGADHACGDPPWTASTCTPLPLTGRPGRGPIDAFVLDRMGHRWRTLTEIAHLLPPHDTEVEPVRLGTGDVRGMSQRRVNRVRQPPSPG